jgi:hypothetical protein
MVVAKGKGGKKVQGVGVEVDKRRRKQGGGGGTRREKTQKRRNMEEAETKKWQGDEELEIVCRLSELAPSNGFDASKSFQPLLEQFFGLLQCMSKCWNGEVACDDVAFPREETGSREAKIP